MGFGGLRDFGDRLSFTPRLPDALTHMSFSLAHRGRFLHVDVSRHRAIYRTLRGSGEVHITHHGEPLTIGAEPVERPIAAAPDRPLPSQPPGREPRSRSPG
jgi:alpha,alpha-trehalose phosphorylase